VGARYGHRSDDALDEVARCFAKSPVAVTVAVEGAVFDL
jgi:hypothetical protein